MVLSAGREAKWTFPVEIVGGDCLAISVVNPVGLCGPNQEAEGNICDFCAVSVEFEKSEVDVRERTSRKRKAWTISCSETSILCW